MSHLTRACCTTCLSLAALALTTTAHAQIADLDLGVGLLGYGNGSFFDEPDSKVVSAGNQQFQVAYPGFGGLGTGFGLALDLRYLGFVGLEIDLLFTEDRGSGDINDIEITLSQSAIHLPVLLKLSVPSAIIKPNAFVGLEWVFPDTPTVESENASVTSIVGVEADSYTLLAFGFGLEIAPPIQGVDLRIPLSFRGGVNLDDTGDINDRTRLDNGRQIFNSQWQWHASVTLGLMYYFL